ncbi:hypothetical protein EHQ58_06480 [Leptospira ognonensis]|uniref:Histidine kinase n=1 Tax=Leptospira ognonensis TaxID=2484945 RepID=A0A4R9K2B4_9LEPT|nr:hypothetical protein [Leptospira ognonensis]TGL60143.1 hypothetical protein EHQ58_06480 [Leptospira ognonensis]
MTLSNRFKNTVDPSVLKNRKIALYTRFLDDPGEEKLAYIIGAILGHHHQLELTELIYTACKEFVMNSTKAAIKRIVYDEMKLGSDGVEPDQEEFMRNFKSSILSQKFTYFKEKMKEKRIQTKISFDFNSDRLIVRVSNNFALLPKEESRIREKFQLARGYDNLPQFFLHHADETEGAGLGITLVGILMSQYGMDRRLLTIYSEPKTNFTVARLEIPFVASYKSKRVLFEEILSRENLTREDLRNSWSLGAV